MKQFMVLTKESNMETHKLVTVYAIEQDSSGYPKFLIYDKGEWKYRSAKHYKPVALD